jgi:GT2 family glycosyltransferase
VRPLPGVSFVIPVRNGAAWLTPVLTGVLAQADGRPMEVVVVDDGSTDGSNRILRGFADRGLINVMAGPGRGAAAALNAGIVVARHPIICQVDQDVVLESGWMTRLAGALDAPEVGAAQGYYLTPPDGSAWARVMGRDLELRYRRILGRDVNHVCTGNTAYRADALHTVGLFDEDLGYGYDNDMSYRLRAAGYRLVIDAAARSVHRWRDSPWTYLVQQYGFGYGRIDLVAKHQHRAGGDDVSQLPMMLHAPVMAAVLVLTLTAGVLAATATGPALWPLSFAGLLFGVLVIDRLVAGMRAAWIFGDAAGLLFVPIHLARDLAWVVAIVVWCTRRLRGHGPRPSHSMRPRPGARPAVEGRQ